MLQPDLSLIRISTLSDAGKYPPVCVTKFVRGEYQLFYVNARHVTNADNATCQTIQSAYDLYNPKGVVIECGGNAAGPHFKGYTSFVLDRYKTPSRAKNECDFTILTALQRSLPLANGEPTDDVVFKDLIARGYSSKEYQAYWLLRGLAQSVKRNEIGHASFDEASEQRLGYLASKHSLPREEQLSVKEYKEWFLHHYPERRDFLDISTNDTAPERPDVGTFSQRLSYDLEKTREPHIIQTITNMLNRHKSVLVVYGGGHRETQMTVFEQMLGQGETHILAPDEPQPKNTTKAAFTQMLLRKDR